VVRPALPGTRAVTVCLVSMNSVNTVDPAERSLPEATAGWDALAADGSVVHIRPVRPDDEAALLALNKRVSDRSIYLRFFGMSRIPADQHSHHLSTRTRRTRM
jgi:hypothetical protein